MNNPKLCAAVLIAASAFSISADDLYLGVNKEKYLIGDYPAGKVLQKYSDKNIGGALVRPDVRDAFEKMIKAYDKDRVGKKNAPPIIVNSSFRGYYDQKYIWESKYKGERKMREPVAGKKPAEIAALILEYSSAPGTSRHHWGTDLDLNSFDNKYFEKGGKGEYLYSWLQENGQKFGFCQPYTELSERGNKGYFLERWHWSYFPVASKLVADWKEAYDKKQIIIKGKFLGSEAFTEEMPKTYVTSINKACLKDQ